MRKDVRTGAAIGGVLLAALVIYAVVTHHHQKKDTSKIVLDTGKSAPAGNTTGGAVSPAPLDVASNNASNNGGSNAAGSGHDNIVTPPAEPNRATDVPPPPKSHVEDVQVNSGNDAAPADAGSAKTASWKMLLSADRVDDYIKPTHIVPVRQDQTIVHDSGTTGNGSEPRRNADTGATHRKTLTETNGSGSSPKTEDSADNHSTPSSAKTHRVVEGETFSSIARATYGDARYFKEIIKANPNIDPAHLRPGTNISLPDKSQFKHDAPPTTGAAPAEGSPKRHPSSGQINPKTEYRVQANDNLYKISEKLYHSANRMDALYQLNKGIIGPDPEKLKLDMVLKLPEPPTETASR